MTVREIQSHLEEMYGTEISPILISSVTDAVMEDAKAWQSRPLDALYPIVYLDCIHVKTRDNGTVPSDGSRTASTGLRKPSMRHSFMATVYRLERIANFKRTELSESPAANRRSRYSARSAPRIRDRCSLAILSVLRVPMRYSSILPDFFRLEISLP